MVNLEKYKNDLIKCGESFGVYKNCVKKCDELNCNYCMFEKGSCSKGKLSWLFKEAELIITQKEKALLDSLSDTLEYYWIARDIVGDLYLFKNKPVYDEGYWNHYHQGYFVLKKDMFKFITEGDIWRTDELKKLEVSKEYK